ncbi:DNA polymerase alpha subunit B [Acipenser oxyrinchus oxyrinchus]|uniref:DNA polymerase alpha subunit B n=1 Tax=Acipenser oxyrinchus oxyrinchus TaxID=40147 RepID=A0AAD8FPU0_ACIOX|nr:DNA polymerase alpha subunit B [Acipenser oxyrinchus oxyrinchus]
MPVPTSKQLSEELSVFDIKCDDDLLDKMLEQCITHRIQEDEVVLEWVAFSTTRGGLPLSLDNLHLFELEVLNKKVGKSRQTAVKKEHRMSNTRDFSMQEQMQAEVEEEDLLDSYSTPAKGSQKRALSTPENPQSKRILSVAPSPRLLLSPASFSPSATPSQKYGSRGGRGEVVCSFGAVQGTWRGQGDSSAQVQLYQGGKDSVTKSYKFMFQKLQDIREVLMCKIEDLGDVLKNHFNIEEFSSSSAPAQEPVVLLGQIGCDSNGKLNSKSVILEGDQEHSYGMQVPVDLSELREYSLFPGQVVVMEGTNSTGRRLVASRLYEGVPLPFHKPKEQSQEDMLEGARQHMVLVACGPYTTSDSMNYEPLMDLIEVIKRDRPDVCLLLGPFLDSKHEQVESGQLTATLDEVFRRCVKAIVEGTRGSGTQLVFVPSQRDVHHDFVFPQPPFHPSHLSQLSGEDRQRVLLLPDPCTLDLSGVVIGVTSTDILFHMGAEEISSAAGWDRFSRILKHILTQRSYYPLYPPAEEMNVDYEQFQAYAQLPVTPDIFITPSELRYFIKDVIGCVCVNPGRLTKGQVGGTYGRLFIKRDTSLEQGMERRSPCAAAQVVKI